MRSIPLAMTWETRHMARLNMAGAIIAANLLPIMIFILLRTIGLEADDPGMRQFLYRFMPVNVLLLGVSFVDYEGTRRRLYSFPISTKMLVACQMFPPMVLSGIGVLFCTFLQGLIFGQKFPLWGPTFVTMSGFGVCWATYWFTKNSISQLFALVLVVGLFGIWYIQRFSFLFDPAIASPVDLTVLEFFVLAILAFASYFVGIAGISRDRQGGQFEQFDGFAWLSELFDRDAITNSRFRTPLEAQFWFEWQLKGVVFPILVAAISLVAFCSWLIFNGEPKNLILLFVVGGVMLSYLGGVAGAVITGNPAYGGSQSSCNMEMELGPFLSSRPITNTDLAMTILKSTAKSLFVTWSIWAVSFLVAAGILIATGNAPDPFFPPSFDWWYFPATLVGMWTATTVGASITLVGDRRRLAQVFLTSITVVVGSMFLSAWLLTHEAQTRLYQTAAVIFGIGFVIGSAWMFSIARRRRFITNGTVRKCIAVWALVSAVIIFEWVRKPVVPLAIYVFCVGIAALTVLPIAATPIAISRNRHR